jgi:NADPH:quinone reductase-like Zn-dependent oxidoreductase
MDVATRAGALAGAGLMTGGDQVGIGWDVAGIVEELGAGVDAAVVGLPALDAVRGGGAFVSVIDGARPLPLRGIRVANAFVRADRAALRELSALVEQGTVALRVADTLPLTEVAEAHREAGERRPARPPGPRSLNTFLGAPRLQPR